MRAELAQAVSATPAERLPNPMEFDAALDEENGGGGRGDDYYASLEQQRQVELMHEQDEQLDGVFRTVGNLRQQASDMGRELEDQAVMIDEVDTLADRVGGKLNNGMARIRHIVRKNEGKPHLYMDLLPFARDGLELRERELRGVAGTNGNHEFKQANFFFPFLLRYMVILLHRGADIRPRAIINSRHRPVIVHHIGRGNQINHQQHNGAWRLRSGRALQSKLILIASLLGRTLLLALVFILVLLHNVKLHVELFELTTDLKRCGYMAESQQSDSYAWLGM